MSARLRAAVQAVQNETYGAGYAADLALIALGAADAVTLSEEAIDRAAEAAYRFDGGDDWASFGERSRERGRQRVRRVIAALLA